MKCWIISASRYQQSDHAILRPPTVPEPMETTDDRYRIDVNVKSTYIVEHSSPDTEGTCSRTR